MSDAVVDRLLALAKALAECQSLANEQARDDIVGLLDDEIRIHVERRRDVLSDDLRKIVLHCARFHGGVQQLLERIGDKESATRQWPAVTAAAEAYYQAAADQARRDAEAAAAAQQAAIGAAGAAQNKLALVIGISRYQHGQAAGMELQAEQFSNLSFADRDARTVYDFLVQEGSYDVLPPLVDDRACLRHILHGLDQLREACQRTAEKNPLVVVFFSGHGATDAAGRSYLVPHDARRNDLFATALWNRTFNAALAEIPTERLVLFVDACHAGAISAEGVKDAGLLQYDPGRLVDEANQRKPYLVASCEAGQVSREFNGHGIFTAHLLELMRCEPPVEFEREDVDLWELYDKLRVRVRSTATEKFGIKQVPFANIDRRTGVVITIDARRRALRRRREGEYLLAVIGEFERRATARRKSMQAVLERSLEGYPVQAHLEGFCGLFQEQAADYQDSGAQLSEGCEALRWRYERDTGVGAQRPTAGPQRDHSTGSLAPVSTAAAPAAAPGADTGPGDGFAAAPAGRQPLDAPRDTGAPPMAATPAPLDRRRLSTDDCEHVLEPIWNPDFLGEARSLKALLSRLEGVSQREVNDWLMNNQPTDAEALAAWGPAAKEIWARFKGRWGTFKPLAMPMMQGAYALRNLRGDGGNV